MDSKTEIGTIFLLVVGVLVVLAMIGPISTDVEQMTNKISMTNESHSFASCRNTGGGFNNTGCNITITNAPSGWRINECPAGSFALRNCTGNTLTVTTDYIFVGSTGIYELKNTSAVHCNLGAHPLGNYTYADYNYCTTGYITSAAGRGVAKLILVFSALGLIAYAIYMGITKSGLIGR